VYSYEILPEARDQVDSLPSVALIYYAELITFVELTPWGATSYREDNPDGNMRKIVFGRAGEGVDGSGIVTLVELRARRCTRGT
jgi:hypothetical protein